MDEFNVADFFAVGGPVVGLLFIFAIITKIISDHRKGRVNIAKAGMESDSAIIRATHEVINMVRSELDSAAATRDRVLKDNEELIMKNRVLRQDNEELHIKVRKLERQIAECKEATTQEVT